MRFRVEMHSDDGGFWVVDSGFWIGFHRGTPSGLGVNVLKSGGRKMQPRFTLTEFVAQQLKGRNRRSGAGKQGVIGT